MLPSDDIIRHTTLSAMHTRMDVVISDISKVFFDEIIQFISFELERIDLLINRHRSDSHISTINKNFPQFDSINPELFDLLNICSDYRKLLLNYFDITCISKTKTLNKVHEITLKQEYILSSNTHNLIKSSSDQIFDFGAIGKGYALDKIAYLLQTKGIENYLISFGESSVLAMGHHPYGDCWKIALPHPEKPDQSLHEFELLNQCLSTSRSVNGHIINPKTAEPFFSKRMVTVKDTNAARAEAISTALICANEDEIPIIKNNFLESEIVIVVV